MKHKALFSSKDNSKKKIKVSSAAILLGTLRVKLFFLLSAASPTPGNVPQHKRGSTASMSQVEDTMFRSVNSSGSLIKAETQSLRSAVSTPDDTSTASSPTKYNTLPGRSKAKAKRRTELV